MDDNIRLLLDELRIIENRADAYRYYLKDNALRQVRLIKEGCQTIRNVVNQVEDKRN